MADKFKVKVDPRPDTGELSTLSEKELLAAIALARWSDDPGTGKAVLLPDGREVFNPVPVAPPIGWKPEPDMFQHMQAMIRRELAGLKGDEIDETLEEASDFDVDEDFDVSSIYEVVDMLPDPGPAPAVSPAAETPVASSASPASPASPAPSPGTPGAPT